jgi:hypothetical protein
MKIRGLVLIMVAVDLLALLRVECSVLRCQALFASGGTGPLRWAEDHDQWRHKLPTSYAGVRRGLALSLDSGRTLPRGLFRPEVRLPLTVQPLPNAAVLDIRFGCDLRYPKHLPRPARLCGRGRDNGARYSQALNRRVSRAFRSRCTLVNARRRHVNGCDAS